MGCLKSTPVWWSSVHNLLANVVYFREESSNLIGICYSVLGYGPSLLILMMKTFVSGLRKPVAYYQTMQMPASNCSSWCNLARHTEVFKMIKKYSSYRCYRFYTAQMLTTSFWLWTPTSFSAKLNIFRSFNTLKHWYDIHSYNDHSLVNLSSHKITKPCSYCTSQERQVMFTSKIWIGGWGGGWISGIFTCNDLRMMGKNKKVSSEPQICGKEAPWKMAGLVRADRKATVTQVTTLYNRGKQKSISGHSKLRWLIYIGFHSCLRFTLVLRIKILYWGGVVYLPLCMAFEANCLLFCKPTVYSISTHLCPDVWK